MQLRILIGLELDADDTLKLKKIVKKLKGASKAHADQAKSLEKELSDDKK